MDKTNAEKLIAMLEVIFSNMLTYLVAAQAALTWVIASGVLDGIPQVAEYLIIALTVIGVAITFIRRVTPVKEEARGLLARPNTVPTDWVSKR